MKNKKLRVGMAMASVLFGGAFLFSACYVPPPLEEIVPTAYGEWDGNYVYHGYTRSKTTGEDTEALIETVTLDGTEYRVTGATDTYFVENEMYSCLSVEPTGELDGDTEDIPKEEITSCLVAYDVEKKTTKVIYYGNEPDAEYIVVVAENDIVLVDYDDGYENVFRIDKEGNLISEDEQRYALYTYCGENNAYMYRTYRQEVYFSDWNGTHVIYANYECDNLIVKYVNDNGVEGLSIEVVYAYYGEEGHPIKNSDETLPRVVEGLCFYDFKTRELYSLVSAKENKVCTLLGAYYITSEEWVANSKRFLQNSLKWEYSGEVAYKNCTLYAISPTVDGVGAEMVYDFDGKLEEMSFLSYSKTETGLQFAATGIKKKSGCKRGGKYRNLYALDLSTRELTSIKKLAPSIVPTTADAVCGKYEYSIDEIEYSYGLAFALLRVDTETGKEETMQFWTSYRNDMGGGDPESDAEGEKLEFRYSEKMWFSAGERSVSPYDFAVRNY